MALLAAFAVLLAPVAATEVRGTWLTTTANDAIRSPAHTASTMKRLREIGLNTVYVEVWKNGYTEFPSETMRKAIGVPLKVNPSPGGVEQRDLLEETMIEAHRNGMVYVAWFEYGFMAAHGGTRNELRARRDWLSLDRSGGDVAKNGFVWLNPLHPDAQNLLLGIVLEAIRKYDIDGIQLDDRIVWPYIDMGYDEFTRRMYARENNGAPVPDDPRDPAWVAWRKAKVEAFSKRLVREARAVGGKDLILSLSPGPHPWALENYLIDWPSWSRWTDNPTWDEYIPQVYRMTYDDFARDWRQQVAFMGERNRDLIAGIRLVGDGPNQRAEDVAKHALLTRETGSMGHAWWFSRGVLDVFPKEIESLYNVAALGHAPHPRFGADWRPKPIVLHRKDSVWHAENVPAGRYRLIVKRDGQWKTERNLVLDRGGRVSYLVPRAEAVELLVRRRG
jgi:uncharacterized lipoprotein YddW (UPF0748 family)